MKKVIGLAALFLHLAIVAARPMDDTSGAFTTVELDPITVTARGIESLASETPGGVGVVSKSEIFVLQPTGIADAARRIPGVEKSSDSPWGSEINIRGLGRDSVIFLIDGCRVNTATDVNARFGLVAPADIERIEVLKGPISALYGSGSTGGVVNVITKKGAYSQVSQNHAEGRVSVSSNPSGAEEYANLHTGDDRWWSYASINHRDAGSYTAGNGDQIPNSQYRDYQGKIYSSFKWTPRNICEFRLLRMEGQEIGIPGQGLSLPEGPDATYSRIGNTMASMVHTLYPNTEKWEESAFQLYYQQIERRVRLDDFPSGTVKEIRPSADHITWGSRWQNRLSLSDHSLVTGIDAGWWRVENTDRIRLFTNGTQGVDSALGDVEQVSAGLFAEDTWQIVPRLTLNTGGRLDTIQDESNDLYNWIKPPVTTIPVVLKRSGQTDRETGWNAHAGLTWRWLDDWNMTLIGASSYRAPDLMERYKYINLGGGIELYGNPDLDPERSYFAEYGLHYNSRVLNWSGAVFANFLRDLITEEAVSASVRRMVNVDSAVLCGVESDLQYRMAENCALYLNAAYTSGRNTTKDDDLDFISPLHGRTGICYQSVQGIMGQIEVEWAAEQNQVPAGTQETPAWVTLNLRGGYHFHYKGLSHELLCGIDNLLNQDYRNALSTSRGIELNEPGICFRAVWNVSF